MNKPKFIFKFDWNHDDASKFWETKVAAFYPPNKEGNYCYKPVMLRDDDTVNTKNSEMKRQTDSLFELWNDTIKNRDLDFCSASEAPPNVVWDSDDFEEAKERLTREYGWNGELVLI